MTTDALFTVQAFAAACMCGVIWFVQRVHYPLMARVGRGGWIDYERAHQTRTTWVVAPPMLVEVISAAWIAARILIGEPEPAGGAWAVHWIGVGLLAGVWASTFLVQVPAHRRLTREWDDAAHASLVRWNWIRTGLWTARALLAAWLAHAA